MFARSYDARTLRPSQIFHKVRASPKTHFLSSYLVSFHPLTPKFARTLLTSSQPCWQYLAQEWWYWQYETSIAQRGVENCWVSFGVLIGGIFDSTPSGNYFSLWPSPCAVPWRRDMRIITFDYPVFISCYWIATVYIIDPGYSRRCRRFEGSQPACLRTRGANPWSHFKVGGKTPISRALRRGESYILVFWLW
jgi:hypothetical protein